MRAALLLALSLTSCALPEVGAEPVRTPRERPTVLVELFTSQGCSSCPPADELLPTLAAAADDLDIEVIPLAFHVDYWDDLGWKDPFSSPVFSRRQRAYAARLPAGRVYTPQLVVGGREHVVGSRRADIMAALGRAAARRDSGRVQIELHRRGREIEAVAQSSVPTGHLFFALVEESATTRVGRGENAGKYLHQAAVVRELRRAVNGKASFAVPAGMRGQIVAFVEDPRRGSIAAAGTADLGALGQRDAP